MKNTLSPLAIAISLIYSHASYSLELEEVVVTAQYKQESLQDTGLAIDALDNSKLIEAGITNADELSQLVPALTITTGSGITSNLYMRGVGNKASNSYLDPAIILTYDGVPVARGSAASIGAFYDLERVEVLKGPQGTLYGKNATGGVLNIIPAKPVIGETEGNFSISAGNYDSHQINGAVNIPVGDNSALRIGASMTKRDGYNNDGTNDDDRKSFRLQFLTEVSDELSIRLSADHSDVGGVGAGTSAIGRYVNQGGVGNYAFIADGVAPEEGANTDAGNAYRRSALGSPGFGFLTDINDEWFVDATLQGLSAEIKYQTGIGELTVIPGWRKTEQESLFSGPGFNSGWWNDESEQKTLEARLSGEFGDGGLEYLVGGFYFEEEIKGNNTFNQEFVLPMQDYVHDADSIAAFTQLTWNISDTSRLITGLRYTDDSKEIDGAINNFITFCGGLGPNLITPPGSFAQGCAAEDGLPRFPTLDTVEEAQAFLVDNGWITGPITSAGPLPLDNGVGVVLHNVESVEAPYDNQETTYRIAYEQDIFEDSLFYVAYETGYRSGGLQPNSEDKYEPELIDAYTLGFKNRLLDNRLQLNMEFFFWDYQDQQISYFNLNGNVLQQTTENVGASTNKGIDLDVLWLATENTLISSKIQYLKASYDDLHFVTNRPRDNINCPFTPLDEGGFDFDCSGSESIYSPEFTWQFGIEQTIPMDSMNLKLGIDTTWTDDQVTGFFNLAHETIESHWRTNANVTLVSADESWSVGAYARNLEDERRAESSQNPLGSLAAVKYGPDMTYGVRFNYNF